MKLSKLLSTIAVFATLFVAGKAGATCSNYTAYTDGQVLTAASLNALQSNYTNCVNDILNGDTLTGNLSFHSGADALFYSDAGVTKTVEVLGESGAINQYGGADLKLYSDSGSTLKAAIFGDGAQAVIPIAWAGYTDNCAIGVSGSTVTISGEGGTALSATNPCLIGVRSNTAGQAVVAPFTANVTFTFGSTSDTDGNLFGISDVNWASSMPIFLGVIYNGTTPYFTISRGPIIQSGAASSDVCQKGDTDCDAKGDVMILTSGLTLASFVNLPITQVGWFGGTYATSGGAWTFTVGTKNGFNKNFANESYTFPSGQMGAQSGTFYLASADTEPTYTNINVYRYSVGADGYIDGEVNFDNAAGGTAGAGTAADLNLVLPFTGIDTGGATDYRSIGSGMGSENAGWASTLILEQDGDGNAYGRMRYNSVVATTVSIVKAADQSSTARELRINYRYRAF